MFRLNKVFVSIHNVGKERRKKIGHFFSIQSIHTLCKSLGKVSDISQRTGNHCLPKIKRKQTNKQTTNYKALSPGKNKNKTTKEIAKKNLSETYPLSQLFESLRRKCTSKSV